MENQPLDKGYALAQQDNQPAAVLPALADAVKRLKMPFFKRRHLGRQKFWQGQPDFKRQSHH
jgi:hypothetical protein